MIINKNNSFYDEDNLFDILEKYISLVKVVILSTLIIWQDATKNSILYYSVTSEIVFSFALENRKAPSEGRLRSATTCFGRQRRKTRVYVTLRTDVSAKCHLEDILV